MLHILICVPNQNPENSDEQLTGNFIKTIVKMSRKKKENNSSASQENSNNNQMKSMIHLSA